MTCSNPSHYYKLCSSAFSMKGSRVLKDSGGRTILNMRHKVRQQPVLPCNPELAALIPCAGLVDSNLRVLSCMLENV